MTKSSRKGKASGFRCNIYFYPNQQDRILKREGMITFYDEDGHTIGKPVQFNYIDEISAKIRKSLEQFEKRRKSKK